jgi:N-acetylmuramoyl-L-alanine amidase
MTAEMKASNSDDITYRVQVYALSRMISENAAAFAGLGNIQRNAENGRYKYSVGSFNTTEAAHAYRDVMVNKGFRDAFVVTFANGKHVSMPKVNN